jgi:predicted AlkP superfamily phosphohydrolase/phosphomutase
VITGTDRLNHFFFDAYYDETHPHHGDFVDYYRRVDTCVGRLHDALGSSSRLIVLSDHGFPGSSSLSQQCKRLGYISFSKPTPESRRTIHRLCIYHGP